MKTTPISKDTLAQSVIAVPPLARDDNYRISHIENQKIIQHIEAGGVRSLLYGGNANLYHVKLSEYADLLAMLRELTHEDTLVVPSVGPAYGFMMEQAKVLADFDFPTVMILPQKEITTQQGIAAGVRAFVEAFGKPIVLYIKFENWLDVPLVQELVESGCVSFIKYAIVRDDPAQDDYLRELVDTVNPELIVSGIGEQPAIVHMRDFGVVSFTSGCVCVAPGLSQQMLAALEAQNYDSAEKIRGMFEPLEDLRNAINPIRVLHHAVYETGIANTGPMLPLLSGIEDAEQQASIRKAAQSLLATEVSQ